MRILALFLTAAFSLQWRVENTASDASLRGIHALSEGAAWASGSGGKVLRFTDHVWHSCATPVGGGKLDFRAVWAWSSKRAIAMSSGPGELSRLYSTEDGCATWRLLKTNEERAGFWDALVFTDERTGYLLGDPVDGRFILMVTKDGGSTWTPDESSGLAAEDGIEGAFAASNSSLAVIPTGELLFGTGGKGGARIFRRHHGSWTSTRVSLGNPAETAGVFSIAFRDALHGVAVGGDFKQPQSGIKTAIWTADGGVTWHSARKSPGGYRSAVQWSESRQMWIAVGPNGTDVSTDEGAIWHPLDKGNWNALSVPWAAGPEGRIAQLVPAR